MLKSDQITHTKQHIAIMIQYKSYNKHNDDSKERFNQGNDHTAQLTQETDALNKRIYPRYNMFNNNVTTLIVIKPLFNRFYISFYLTHMY